MESENNPSDQVFKNQGMDPDPITLVFSNPLLMECIFGHVIQEGLSLKQLRLVCAQWNDAILDLPDPSNRLVLNNHAVQRVCEPETFIDFSNNMDSRLSRNVSLLKKFELNSMSTTGLPGDSQQGWRLESVGYMNMKYCIQKYSSTIQTIDLLHTGIKIDFVKILHQLLQNHCPNLVKFLITADSLPEEHDARNRPSYVSQTWANVDFASIEKDGGPISPKSKLKRIEVDLCNLLSQIQVTGPLHDLYSSLIKSSPNLIELKQEIISFPDCTHLLQIKSFQFDIYFFLNDFESITGTLYVKFNLKGLTRMIKEMSKSLQHLQFSGYHQNCKRKMRGFNCPCSSRLGFEMPVMENLKSFRCSDVDIFFTNEETLTNVSPFQVGDQLRHMEIGQRTGTRNPGTGRLIKKICDSATLSAIPISAALTSLTVNGISNLVPCLMNLKNAFPSLKKLSINTDFGIYSYGWSNDEDENAVSCKFAQAMNVARILNLESIEVVQALPKNFETFVTVLHNNVDLFSGGRLKSLRVIGLKFNMNMDAIGDYADEENKEEVIRKLNASFLSMKNMTTVTFVNTEIVLPIVVAQQIFRLIGGNSLKINFEESN